MKLLTDKQRAFALKRLAEADDDILLGALAEIRQRDVRIEAAKRQLNEEFGVETCAEMQVEAPPVKEPVPRRNVSPGPSSITKISPVTEATLLGGLGKGHCPVARWNEHLKLLWTRGKVKFDGKEYYL